MFGVRMDLWLQLLQATVNILNTPLCQNILYKQTHWECFAWWYTSEDQTQGLCYPKSAPVNHVIISCGKVLDFNVVCQEGQNVFQRSRNCQWYFKMDIISLKCYEIWLQLYRVLDVYLWRAEVGLFICYIKNMQKHALFRYNEWPLLVWIISKVFTISD